MPNPYYARVYNPTFGALVRSGDLRAELIRIELGFDSSYTSVEAALALRARIDLSNSFLLSQNFAGGFSVGAGVSLNFGGATVQVATNPTATASTDRAASEAFVQNAIASTVLNPASSAGQRAIRQARWAHANLS